MPNTNAQALSGDLLHKTSREILSFFLDGEEFGVDILTVKEIRVWSKVTDVPSTPQYMKGVINLRGTIIPIVDLSERFSRPAKEYNDTTVVIVLHSIQEDQDAAVGIVVDAVSDVYKLEEKHIRNAPEFGSDIDSRFINGMATFAEKIVILLNADMLLDSEELYKVTHRVRAV